MIKDNVLLILGAGSNVPYDFPTGKALRKSIVDKFAQIYQQIVNKVSLDQGNAFSYFYIKEHEKINFGDQINDFCVKFEKSSTPSIDLFLSRNPEFTFFGKLAIVLFILEAEINSRFREKMHNSNYDWYSFLFNAMAKTLTKANDFDKFRDNKINVITFNYDRSLEHFLFESFCNSFGSHEELNQKLQNPHLGYAYFKSIFPFEFVHVYGKLADLPWQSGKSLAYGSVRRKINPIEYIGNIKTIYEIQENGSNTKSNIISELIQEAQKIFFLGFGFAEENMESLGMPDLLRPDQQIYATAYGFTDKEINDLYSVFYENRDLYNTSEKKMNNLIIKNIDSLALLREYL